MLPSLYQAHAASLSDQPLILDPITALPRSRFPLSWIDDAFSSSRLRSDAQPGGLFVADIPALENDLRGTVEPTVIVVRLVGEGAIYVVERVKRGIYSLSRLMRWVRESDIVVAAKGWQGSRDLSDLDLDLDMGMETDSEECVIPDALNWWQAARIKEPLSDLGLGEEFAGLQVDMVFGQSQAEAVGDESSFVDVEFRSQPAMPQLQGVGTDDVFYTPLESQLNEVSMDVDGLAQPAEGDAKQTPTELLEGMRDHYLQALYISKVSTVVLRLWYPASDIMTRHPWPTLLKVL